VRKKISCAYKELKVLTEDSISSLS